MDSEIDKDRESEPQEFSTPDAFSPFSADWVVEFLEGNSYPTEPEEEPPRNLRRRLAWLRERRDRKSRETSTRQQQYPGADWSGADKDNQP